MSTTPTLDSTHIGSNPTSAGASQSRRFACDRCHQYKLKCERSPIAVEGGAIIPYRPCKRCIKATAECQTTPPTFAGYVNSAATTSRGTKRKLASDDDDDEGHGQPFTPDGIPDNFFALLPSLKGSSIATMDDIPPSHDDSFMIWCERPTDNIALFNSDAFTFDAGVLASDDGPSPLDWPSWVDDSLQGFLNIEDEPREERNIYNDQATDMTWLTETPNTTTLDPLTPSFSDALGNDFQTPAQDARKSILELHALIFTHLDAVTDSDLADTVFRSSPPATLTGGTDDSFASPNSNIIHRLLHASNMFIGILHSPFSTLGSACNLPIVTVFLTSHLAILCVYRTVFEYIMKALGTCEAFLMSPNSNIESLRPFPSFVFTPSSAIPTFHRQGHTPGSPSKSSEQILNVRIKLEIMTHMLECMEDTWYFATGLSGTEAAGDYCNPYSNHQSQEQCSSPSLSPTPSSSSLLGSQSNLILLRSMLLHEGFDRDSEEEQQQPLGVHIGFETLKSMTDDIRGMLRGSVIPERQ